MTDEVTITVNENTDVVEINVSPNHEYGRTTGARLYNSTDMVLVDSDSRRMIFDSMEYDDSNYHNSYNPSRLTIPSDGKYLFGCAVSIQDNPTGIRVGWILKNGADVIAKNQVSPPQTSNDCVFTMVGCDNFSAEDYIELWLYQNSGSDLNVLYDAKFSCYFWIQQPSGGPQGPSGSGSTRTMITNYAPTGAIPNVDYVFNSVTGEYFLWTGTTWVNLLSGLSPTGNSGQPIGLLFSLTHA